MEQHPLVARERMARVALRRRSEPHQHREYLIRLGPRFAVVGVLAWAERG